MEGFKRYKMWLIILAISLGIKTATVIVKWLVKEKENITITVDTNSDLEIGRKIYGQSYSNIRLTNSENLVDSDVIITDKPMELGGYERYGEVLNTPMVLFTPKSARNKSIVTGFTKIDDTNYFREADLYSILVGLEQGKTWQEVGISEEIVNGKIRLVIPRENTPYYPYVIESIYSTLLQGVDDVKDEDLENIKERVINIISLCETSDNILNLIAQNKTNKNLSLDYLIIGPEYLISKNTALFGDNSYGWMPVYFKNTSQIAFDVYIKENLDESIKEDVKHFLLVSKTIHSKSGLRSNLRNFKIDTNYEGYYSAVNIISTTKLPSEVRGWIKEWVQEIIRSGKVSQSTYKEKVIDGSPGGINEENTQEITEETNEGIVEEITEESNEENTKEIIDESNEETKEEIQDGVTDEVKEENLEESTSSSVDSSVEEVQEEPEDSSSSSGFLILYIFLFIIFLTLLVIPTFLFY